MIGIIHRNLYNTENKEVTFFWRAIPKSGPLLSIFCADLLQQQRTWIIKKGMMQFEIVVQVLQNNEN